MDTSHKVQRGRLMRPVLNEANAARDATKGVLATCSNPATTDRRKDRGARPANYSIVKYHRPTYDNHYIVPVLADVSVTTTIGGVRAGVVGGGDILVNLRGGSLPVGRTK